MLLFSAKISTKESKIFWLNEGTIAFLCFLHTSTVIKKNQKLFLVVKEQLPEDINNPSPTSSTIYLYNFSLATCLVLNSTFSMCSGFSSRYISRFPNQNFDPSGYLCCSLSIFHKISRTYFILFVCYLGS